MNRDLSEKWPPAKARYTFPPTIRPAIQGGSAAYGAVCLVGGGFYGGYGDGAESLAVGCGEQNRRLRHPNSLHEPGGHPGNSHVLRKVPTGSQPAPGTG
jgi:hypothetical protein